MTDFISKGSGPIDESTARTAPASDSVQVIGGHDGTGAARRILVKSTGELDQPALETRLGAPADAAAANDAATAGIIPFLKRLAGKLTADLGQAGDGAAGSDTGSASLLALCKRHLQQWTVLLARIPALVSGRVPVDGSGVTQPVSVAALPLPSGAATAANQTAVQDNGRNRTIETVQSAGVLEVQTSATGANFALFASQACRQLTLLNDTGTDLEVQRGGTGQALRVQDGMGYTFRGLTNANQLGVRRVDQSNTQVSARAEWEN